MKQLRWVYDWITVITAASVGLLHALDGINLAPLIGSERALQVVTVVAIVKAVLAFIESRRA